MAADETRRIKIWINDKEVNNDIRSIQKEFRKLTSEVKAADIGSKEYIKHTKELKRVGAILQEHRNNVSGVSKAWQNMKSTMLGVFAGNVVTGAMDQIMQFFPQMIKGNAELSDSYADVAKTTGLSVQQVQMLSSELKKIDTRSSRKELLELARQAGKLGIQGSEDVLKFVQQADLINVALGEDLGDDAILQIGKIASAFNTDMLKIGSAINSVGQNSKAQEQYLVNFTSRMQGTGVTAKIAASDIIGYAATLDSLGLQAEMSATALNKFFIDFVKDTEKFESAAGLANGSLTSLIGSEGTNAGFIKFIQSLKESTSSQSEFLKKLDEIGVEGARGSQVFLALSNNLEQVKDMQSLANKEFERGLSINEEFNIKNNNLAASWAKLQKIMAGWMTNSKLVNGLTTIISSLADVRSEAAKLSDEWQAQKAKSEDLQRTLPPLAERYDELKTKSELSREEHNELQTIIQQIIEIMPGAASEWDEYNRVVGVNTEMISGNIEIQKEVTRIKMKDAIMATRKELAKLTKEEKGRNITMDTYIKKNQDLFNSMSIQEQMVGLQKKTLLDWNKVAAEYQEGTKAVNINIAEATLKLQEFGIELSVAEKSMIDLVLGTNQFAEATKNAKEEVIDESDLKNEVEIMATMATSLEILKTQLKENIQARTEFAQLDMDSSAMGRMNQLIAESKLLEAQIEQLEIMAGLRDPKGGSKTKPEKHDEYLNSMKTLYERERALTIAYYEEQRQLGLSDLEKLNEEYENRLISHAEYLDRKRDLDMVEQARKGAEELASGNGMYAIPDPTSFGEELVQFFSKVDAQVNEWRNSTTAINLQRILNTANQAYDTMLAASNAFLDIKAMQDQREIDLLNKKFDYEDMLIQKQLDNKVISAESAAYQSEKIEKQRLKREAAIRIAAFKREKTAALIQAGINGALAITQAIAQFGPPPSPVGIAAMASAGIISGAQIATIASSKPPIFEQGGFIAQGASHAEGGIQLYDTKSNRIVGEMQGREPILTAGVTDNPELLAAVSRINVMAGGRQLVNNDGSTFFDEGGIAPSSNANSTDMTAMINSVLRRLSMPVKAYVVAEEVNKVNRNLDTAERIARA